MQDLGEWDHSPASRLKAAPGELWVEIKLKRAFSATDRETKLLDHLIELVRRKRIGVYTGRSSGGGAMDVTFDVKNRAVASQRLRKLLLSEFPGTPFSISARYLARFFDPTRKPPRSSQLTERQLTSLIDRLKKDGWEVGE